MHMPNTLVLLARESTRNETALKIHFNVPCAHIYIYIYTNCLKLRKTRDIYSLVSYLLKSYSTFDIQRKHSPKYYGPILKMVKDFLSHT